MSGNFEPVLTETNTIAPLSHRRILWTMAIVVFIAGILCSIFVSWQFSIGFVIGGILAFLNYYWLKVSLKRIFDKAIGSGEGGEMPRFLGANYFLRYLAFGAILCVVYFSQIVPIVAVLLGLCVFAVALVIEGLLRILSSISKREEF
jgi:hypothetical protein